MTDQPALTPTVEAPAPDVVRIALDQFRRDGGTQSRAWLDTGKVAEYAELLKAGVQLPAVDVIYDGSAYWLWDGFHRIAAAEKAQLADYPARVTQGTQRDAVLKSAGANATHGIRRSQYDVERAVTTLLNDDEWMLWSNEKLADAAGVVPSTIANYRRKLGKEVDVVKAADGRTMNVARIGKKAVDLTDWEGKILKPYLAQHHGALVVFPHKGIFLLLGLDYEDKDKLGLEDISWFNINGSYSSSKVAKLDQTFVDALKTSREVVVADPAALDAGMQAILKAAARQRTTVSSFTPLAFEVRLGDLVADAEGTLWRVDQARPTSLHVGLPAGGDFRADLRFNRVRPVESARVRQDKPSTPGYGVYKSLGVPRGYGEKPPFDWQELHRRFKEFYAVDPALLFIHAGAAYLALGDDAIYANALVNADAPLAPFFPATEHGPVLLVLDRAQLDEIHARGAHVWIYSDDRPGLVEFWNGLLASRLAAAAAPAPQPEAPAIGAPELAWLANRLALGDRVLTPDGRAATVAFFDEDGDDANIKVTFTDGGAPEWFLESELKPAPEPSPAADPRDPTEVLAIDGAILSPAEQAAYELAAGWPTPAPVARPLAVGDQVTTRTGHIGEIRSINGAHAGVLVGRHGYTTEHKLADLTPVEASAPEPPPAPVPSPADTKPLAAGDTVRYVDPTSALGLRIGRIDVVSGGIAFVRFQDGTGKSVKLRELAREGEAPTHQLGELPAAAPKPALKTGALDDLAPGPWTLRRLEVLDAFHNRVCVFAEGLDGVAAEIVRLVNAATPAPKPAPAPAIPVPPPPVLAGEAI